MATRTSRSPRTKNLQRRAIDWDALPLSLTRAEAAAAVGVGLTAIREAIHLGQLRETRYGLKTCRISRYDLQAYHEGREKQPVIVPLPVVVEIPAEVTEPTPVAA